MKTIFPVSDNCYILFAVNIPCHTSAMLCLSCLIILTIALLLGIVFFLTRSKD